MEPPELLTVRPLRTLFGVESPFENRLDCGPFRYHLLLEYNETEPQAQNDDDDAIDSSIQGCLALLPPFIKVDSTSRSKSDRESPTGELLVELQVVTLAGKLQFIRNNRHIKHPPNEPVPNIEILGQIVWHISKVEINGSVCCLKSVHRSGGEQGLKRELSIRLQCSHPTIIRFTGLVEPASQEDKVEGMVIEYIDNSKSLGTVSISQAECDKWTPQIRSAIEYLPANGLRWSDAKAGDV